MKIYATLLTMALATTCASQAYAFDEAKYEAQTSATIRELIAGQIPDQAATLARLKDNMAIGVEACKEYIAKSPADAALLTKVIAEAPNMTNMTAAELEEAWGDDGKAGDSVGRPLKSVANDGVTRGFLDIVVHPGRAYDLIVEYGKTHNAADLEEAKGELIESLEHLKKASAAL